MCLAQKVQFGYWLVKPNKVMSGLCVQWLPKRIGWPVGLQQLHKYTLGPFPAHQCKDCISIASSVPAPLTADSSD
ncbi:hypothetical protein Tco_0620027 [Tanacetum coccineum]